jgi:hypothetical protein
MIFKNSCINESTNNNVHHTQQLLESINGIYVFINLADHPIYGFIHWIVSDSVVTMFLLVCLTKVQLRICDKIIIELLFLLCLLNGY